VLLTFGLLSPNKGIENVLQALPAVIKNHPDVAYIILGATHPHILKSQTHRIPEVKIVETSKSGDFFMIQQLTYEKLEQRIQALTKEAFERKRVPEFSSNNQRARSIAVT